MKKLIMMVIAMGALAANATLLLYEPFDYTTTTNVSIDGLTPSIGNRWYANTAPSYRNGIVGTGSLTAPSGFATPIGNKFQLNTGGSATATNYFTSALPVTGGQTYYFSYLLQVVSNKWSAGTVQQQGGFVITNGSGIGNMFVNVGLLCPNSTTNAGQVGNYFQIALQKGGAGGYAVTNSTQYSFGTTLLVVGAYTAVAGLTNDISKLWINPDVSTFGSATEPTPTLQFTWRGSVGSSELSGTGGTNGIGAFKFAGGSSNPGSNVDELRVGTTWADVTPIPEPATVGMLGLGALVTLLIRRIRG